MLESLAETSMSEEFLKSTIRSIPDWPIPGVNFRDITPVLESPEAFRFSVRWMCEQATRVGADLVAGVDARGFIFAGAVAHELGLPLVPVRKSGKLPYKTISASYQLEYGEATVEIHEDAVKARRCALLIDDLIATGGTLTAAARLLERAGADAVHVAALVDLPELGGSQRLRKVVHSLSALVSFTEAE